MNLFDYIANEIRELRTNYGGQGISQEALANALGVATNTVSRWETSTYHPSLEDLDKLARFFGESILVFFPAEPDRADDKVAALLRAARQLPPEDIDELRRYAEFRRARSLYEGGEKPRAGRKKKAVS
jgi:transcriptional regulator with XRE-family HTH domain